MNSQSMMWLCSLLVVTLMSIPGFIRTPIRWWWDALVRIFFIILICVAGMIVPAFEWYAVSIGWGFVLFCFFAQKLYEKQQQIALLALDSTKLRNAYKNIEWLNWGLNGSFYRDLNESMALYIDQKPEEAEKVLARWDKFPGMPAQLLYLPRAYRTTGDHILGRWQKLIDDYESLVKEPEQAPQMVPTESNSESAESSSQSTESNSESSSAPTEPNDKVKELQKNAADAAAAAASAATALRKASAQMMLLHVARAYAEQNRLWEAACCLTDFKVTNQANLNQQQLALTFLPFFALSGEMDRTRSLLEAIKRPTIVDRMLQQTGYCKEHAKYWLARCARASGDESLARECFQQARELSETDLFRSRIDLQLSREPQLASGTGNGADRVWADVKAAEFVQDIFRPVKTPWSVLVIILSIFAVFPFTDLFNLLNDPPKYITPLIGMLGTPGYIDLMKVAEEMAKFVIGNFVLMPPLVLLKGEVWRLVSYLFIHGHFTHMMLNVLGLFFFGRMAESIFGAPKFLAIYFLGGILSGVFACVINFNEPVAGASGAILAVFGAVGAAIYKLKGRMPEPVWRKQVSVMVTLGCAQVLLDHANIIKHVAGSVHLGGLLVGVLIGLVMPTNITKRYPAAQGNATAKDSVDTKNEATDNAATGNAATAAIKKDDTDATDSTTTGNEFDKSP